MPETTEMEAVIHKVLPGHIFHFVILSLSGSLSLCGLFSSCGKHGYTLVVVRRLLITIASLATDHRLWGLNTQRRFT